MTLTKRERRAFAVYQREGELNEGMLAREWPLIRNPRLVTNSLCRKGLMDFGAWLDENEGYQMLLTERGEAVLMDLLRELLTPRGPLRCGCGGPMPDIEA